MALRSSPHTSIPTRPGQLLRVVRGELITILTTTGLIWAFATTLIVAALTKAA